MRAENEEYILEMLGKGAREHEREHMQYREIKIQTNTIPHAEGSATVDIGNTKVLVGVKLAVGAPLPDKPDEGALVTGAELLPLASAEYETGPPSPEAIEFARVVDRGIRAAEVVDLDALFIEKDKVWTTFVDIYVLNYDGNLFDAATLASTTALLGARMPKYEDGNVIREGNLGRLKTKGSVTSCTFAKVGKNVLLDPNGNEERIMSARLTIANDQDVVKAMQKGLRGSFSYKELTDLVDATFDKSKQLRDMVNKAVGE
ncbi:MAG: exosome complex protein Rrp42 [Candidatus Micrarchaeota archaeon]|nr:exosome complex protein Rrp42 [Candidatus Micrarchaeota archaeon]